MKGRWPSLALCLIAACSFLLLPRPGRASQEETIPAYHWSYPVIDQLRLRGYFTDLFIADRPFTRGAIARSLQEIQREIDAGRRRPTRAETWLLDRLNAEFGDERPVLHPDTLSHPDPDTLPYRLKLGVTGTLDGLHRARDLERSDVIHYGVVHAGTRVREGIRSRLSAGIGDHITLYHTLRLDRNLLDDPAYIGKPFRGMAGFTEQAYVQGRYGPVGLKVGRDFLMTGAGKSGHLLLSDNSRPFDLYRLEVTASFLRFTAFGIQLDDTPLDSVIVPGQGPVNTARRFINGHRLDVRVGRWAQFGVSEVVIYGGPRRTFELAYINPVNFYHGVTLNDEDALGRPANTLGSLDMALFPVPRLEVFGELLIDDVKIEKVNLSDLEPNKIGLLAGLRYANPFGLDGVTLHTEYARVGNRTYNVLFNPWERFLHRNRPIGHFLGSNFDRFEAGASAWAARSLFVSARYERLRQGRDNIASPYNTDYLNVPSIEDGYSEPFPFGPVQRTHAVHLAAEFSPSIDIRFQAELRLAHVDNFAFTGVSRNQVQLLRVGVFVNYEHIWGWR